MGTRNRWGRLAFAAALLLMAGAGALLGQLIVVRSAAACDCTPATWPVLLVEATADGPAANEAAKWPQRGLLTTYPGSATIDAQDFEEGGLFRMEADR